MGVINEEVKDLCSSKLTREYFERGCKCININGKLQACPSNMSDLSAVDFYEKNCKCDRNYIVPR